MVAAAGEWVEASCRAKSIPHDRPIAAEEISSGPLAVARQLRLLGDAFARRGPDGVPPLPGPVRRRADGTREVQVLPARGVFDRVVFRGFTARVQVDEGAIQTPPGAGQGVCTVLGAGNLTSIPCSDALTKLFVEGRPVLLKASPLHAALVPAFERAFRPLIERDLLRVVAGDAELGAAAVAHPAVEAVHLTGSRATYDRLVWGEAGPARERRRAAGTPLLEKTITCELGNVTPVIVAPGAWRERDLARQAEAVAGMIVHNASFNCLAAKVLVTWRRWAQRARFLELVQQRLAAIPPRFAYHPGARERFERFAGRPPDRDDGTLPWTLLPDRTPDGSPELFAEESFVCVAAETALEAGTPGDFLARAAAFANERIAGNLAACMIVPPALRRAEQRAVDAAVDALRYGTVAVNHWPALSFALMCTPWGAYPTGTLAEPQSGIGWAHDTAMLRAPRKVLFDGPFRVWPKPPWLPSHARAHEVMRRLLDLYHRPSLFQLARAIAASRPS